MRGRGRGCRYEKENSVENGKGKEAAKKISKRKNGLKSPTTTAIKIMCENKE